MPYRFKIDKHHNVLAAEHPGDGTDYPIDMERLFPKQVINDMSSLYYDGIWDRMDLDIKEQVKLYFHQ